MNQAILTNKDIVKDLLFHLPDEISLYEIAQKINFIAAVHKETIAEKHIEHGNGANVLALLQTPRYAQRPATDDKEIAKRIESLRNDWDDT